jgi:hypothetical protein
LVFNEGIARDLQGVGASETEMAQSAAQANLPRRIVKVTLRAELLAWPAEVCKILDDDPFLKFWNRVRAGNPASPDRTR